MSLDGLGNINIELTSRCNKHCWMCGRRRIERDYPELALEYGDMDFQLVERLARQLPDHIVVQLHNNGEALLYPRFGEAVELFHRQITNIVTNGKLLVDKADEIIGKLDTLAISVVQDDDEADEQYRTITKFLQLKGDERPTTLLRFVGDVDRDRYSEFGLLSACRVLHSPFGSVNYEKTDPTVPEIGICLDFLHHLAVDRKGRVSICVRFDPTGKGVIGDANVQTLEEIWNSPKRLEWLEYHKRGQRQRVPLCARCHFWGVPTGVPGKGKIARIGLEEIF